MDKDMKARWVAALRSGAFEQGHGQLKRRGGFDGTEFRFCCLGVLAEIEGGSTDGCYLNPADSRRFGLLQNSQAELANANDGRLKLVHMIDEKPMYVGAPPEGGPVLDLPETESNGPRASFSSIANWIEANL